MNGSRAVGARSSSEARKKASSYITNRGCVGDPLNIITGRVWRSFSFMTFSSLPNARWPKDAVEEPCGSAGTQE